MDKKNIIKQPIVNTQNYWLNLQLYLLNTKNGIEKVLLEEENLSTGIVEEWPQDDPNIYLKIDSPDLTRCSGSYLEMYAMNSHNSCDIKTEIRQYYNYQGDSNGWVLNKKRIIIIKCGKKYSLGCSGWNNPTGADTKYKWEFTDELSEYHRCKTVEIIDQK